VREWVGTLWSFHQLDSRSWLSDQGRPHPLDQRNASWEANKLKEGATAAELKCSISSSGSRSGLISPLREKWWKTWVFGPEWEAIKRKQGILNPSSSSSVPFKNWITIIIILPTCHSGAGAQGRDVFSPTIQTLFLPHKTIKRPDRLCFKFQ